MNLRETQRTSKLNVKSLKINVNDIVLIFYEKVARYLWSISIVTQALTSTDSQIREAKVRIAKTNTILKRPTRYNQTDKANHKEIAYPSPAVR